MPDFYAMLFFLLKKVFNSSILHLNENNITVLASTTVDLYFFTLFSFRLIRSRSTGSI